MIVIKLTVIASEIRLKRGNYAFKSKTIQRQTTNTISHCVYRCTESFFFKAKTDSTVLSGLLNFFHPHLNNNHLRRIFLLNILLASVIPIRWQHQRLQSEVAVPRRECHLLTIHCFGVLTTMAVWLIFPLVYRYVCWSF